MIRTGWIFAAAALALSLGAWAWLARELPQDAAHVPVHWNASGAPDRFAPRGEALALFGLFPGVIAAFSLLFTALPSIEPLKANLVKSRRAFLAGWIGMSALMALCAVGAAMLTLGSTAGQGDGRWMVRAVVAGTGVLFILLGDALPKTRPNFFVGVRTPWTLSSDLAWEKSNRLAGRLFVLLGLWNMIAAFVIDGVALAFAIAGPAIAIALVAAVHSYFVWRSDPDKRQAPREA